MKVFIVYASAGSGHFKAAEAAYNYLKQENCNLELKLVDVLDNTSFLFRNIYSYGYKFLVSYAPWIWALGFYITYIKPLRPVIKCLNFIITRLSTAKFARLLIDENPDFIISTHFLPSEISSYLKRTRKIKSRLVTVITDFAVHPFWITKGSDIYVVALDFTKKQLIQEGVKEEDIKVLGIPIDQKFLREYELEALCAKFGLDQNKFTLLITTGSFAIGPIEPIVDLLYKDTQILVVCAKNKRLYKRLKHKNYPNVKFFGYIDNIQELMAVSDIVITKPGGLTISESLIRELLPIFIAAIPGQETANAKILESYGIGLIVRRAEDIKDKVLDYITHPDKLNRAKENIKRVRKPNVLREICNVICLGSAGDTRRGSF